MDISKMVKEANWNDINKSLPFMCDIPDKYKSWYIESSGTRWIHGKWIAIDNHKFYAFLNDKKKVVRKEMLNWFIFEDLVLKIKEYFRSFIFSLGLDTRLIRIDNELIFDLMTVGETDLKYKKEGQDFIKHIKTNEFLFGQDFHRKEFNETQQEEEEIDIKNIQF